MKLKGIVVGLAAVALFILFVRTFGLEGIKEMYSTGQETVTEVQDAYNKIDDLVSKLETLDKK